MSNEERVALVADDHELFRTGFSLMLKRECGFSEVLEASTLDDAFQFLGERGDVALATFDLAMPGVDSPVRLQSIREVFPALRIAVVTGSARREDMLLALNAGVHGYIMKTWPTAEIVRAIQAVVGGSIFVPSSIADLPRSDHQATGNLLVNETTEVHLTPRQKDVLRLIRSGLSNKEIARQLNLTESTVKVHTSGLYRALGVHNRSSAASKGVL